VVLRPEVAMEQANMHFILEVEDQKKDMIVGMMLHAKTTIWNLNPCIKNVSARILALALNIRCAGYTLH
jgi:hypothetical protein